VVGLRRGSLPAFRLPSHAAAAGTVLVGLVTLGAGSGLAASVLNSESPPRGPTRRSRLRRAHQPLPGQQRRRRYRRPRQRSHRRHRDQPSQPPREDQPGPRHPRRRLILGLHGRRRHSPSRSSACRRLAKQTSPPRPPAPAPAPTAPSWSTTNLGHPQPGPRPETRINPGAVTWSWLVGSRTTLGIWPVTVTCSRSGRTDTTQRFLSVPTPANPADTSHRRCRLTIDLAEKSAL
jgi:hypothetical protein